MSTDDPQGFKWWTTMVTFWSTMTTNDQQPLGSKCLNMAITWPCLLVQKGWSWWQVVKGSARSAQWTTTNPVRSTAPQSSRPLGTRDNTTGHGLPPWGLDTEAWYMYDDGFDMAWRRQNSTAEPDKCEAARGWFLYFKVCKSSKNRREWLLLICTDSTMVENGC